MTTSQRVFAAVLASLLTLPVFPPQPVAGQDAQSSAVPEPELLRRLANLGDSLSKAGQFSGVILLARSGSPIFQRAYGLADRARSLPNNTETAFDLGSINKVFTQIAIQQLVGAGKLELDSTLSRYWPDYPNPDVAGRVTIRQLLQHKSGIGGDIFGDPASGNRHDIRGLKDFLPLFVGEPLQFEPGSQTAYSNAGYIVLGLLIERISGQNYYDYVREHIFQPAGMTRTASFAPDSLPANTAIGYTQRAADGSSASTLRPNTTQLPGRGSSAGGGYSTAGDLLKFLNALRARRIENGLPAGLGIAGGAPGINATVDGDLPGGYDLIVLANLDPPAAQRVARTVRPWLGGRD